MINCAVRLCLLVVPEAEEEEEPKDQDELEIGWCAFLISSNATPS